MAGELLLVCLKEQARSTVLVNDIAEEIFEIVQMRANTIAIFESGSARRTVF